MQLSERSTHELIHIYFDGTIREEEVRRILLDRGIQLAEMVKLVNRYIDYLIKALPIVTPKEARQADPYLYDWDTVGGL